MNPLLFFSLCFSLCLIHVYSQSVYDRPYNLVMFKAAHNSEQREENLADQLTFNPVDNYQGGCRQVELDIWRHDGRTDEGLFTVDHDSPSSGQTLSYWLNQLIAWHAYFKDHDVISVLLDIKSQGNGTDFPEQIDWYLNQYFIEIVSPNSVFFPASLFLDNLDLVSSVRKNGWPTVGQLKNKFLFVLTGNTEWKANNAAKNPRNRTCFSDHDLPDNTTNVTPPLSGNEVFFNTHLLASDFSSWSKTIPPFRAAGFLTRGWVIDINDEDLWRMSLQAGVNAPATNMIRDYDWAMVGGGYPFRATP